MPFIIFMKGFFWNPGPRPGLNGMS